MDTIKTCPVCGEPVPPSRGSRPRIYCSNRCRGFAWNKANPEKVKAKANVWRKANPEKYNEYVRAKYAANPEKERERSRARYAENPEKINGYKLDWVSRNRDRVNKINREWIAANPEKRKEKTRKLIESMSDAYIASLIGLPTSLVPKYFIEAKRFQLKLMRELKEKK